MDRSLIVYSMQEGEPTEVASLFAPAYAEFAEFHTRSYAEFHAATKEGIEDNPRLEVLKYAGDRLVGFAVIALDDDAHVGLCVSVQWQYALPEYRDSTLLKQTLRTAEALAEASAAPSISYSHRIGAGEYRIKYRRAKWARK